MKRDVLLALLPSLLLGLSACEKPAEQTVASGQTKTAAQAGLEPAQVERGRLVYMKNCQTCHGLDGKGQPGDWRVRKANGLYPPPPLDDTAHAWHHPTAVLRKAILEGSPPDMGDMPPWKDKLLGEEIDDVIVYIKSLWSDEVYRHWLEIERNALEN